MEQTNQLRKFGEQIAEVLGKPPFPLKRRRDIMLLRGINQDIFGLRI